MNIMLMKETPRFYSSLGLLIILNIIIKPVWIFGIDRSVQNITGTEVYGLYFSLLGFSIVFNFLLDWGLSAFINRELAAAKESHNNIAGSFLAIKLLLVILYVVVVFFAALISGIGQWDIFWSVVVIQVLTSLFLFFRSIITAQQWFRTDAWLSVLDKILMIIVCGSFLLFPSVTGTIDINLFLLIQIGCTAIVLLISIVVLLRKGFIFSLPSSPLFNKRIFKSALPFGLIVLLMSAHYRLDGFLLERLHGNGAYETGIYAGAYRLLDAANMPGYLTASFLLPFIARQYSLKKDMSEVILNSRHLLLVFSLMIAIIAAILSPWLQQILYHDQNAEAIEVLQWCLPVLIAYSLVQIYGTVLTATGHIVPFCYIVLASVVANVLLNLLLIPGLGARGSCFAALVSQGFCGIGTMLYTRQKLGINIHYRSLLMYIFMGVMMFGFLYTGNKYISNKWWLLAGLFVISITASTILKLSDIHKWKTFLKQTTNN